MKSYSQSEIERFAKIINANKSVIDKLSNVDIVVSASYILNDYNNIDKIKRISA